MAANVSKAITFFEKSVNDSRALNALGYIYYEAPDYLETNQVLLARFGRIRKN